MVFICYFETIITYCLTNEHNDSPVLGFFSMHSSGVVFLFVVRVAVCAILRVDMKHNTPTTAILPLRRSRGAVFRRPPKKTDVEFVLFENLTLTEDDFPGLTFRNCRFTGCRISGIALDAAFIDCVLEHCDCSNVNLQKASLERTRLSDCKLVGATLSEAFLLDVSLIDCIARYSNFSSSKIRHTRFTDCDLSHAAQRLQAGKDRIRTLPAHSGGVVSNTVCRHGSLRLRHFASRSAARSCEMRA